MEGPMEKEVFVEKMVKLVDLMTMCALDLPEDQRLAWIDQQITDLKNRSKFPDGYPELIGDFVRERLTKVCASGGGSIIGSA
jgi:hypothetical protein